MLHRRLRGATRNAGSVHILRKGAGPVFFRIYCGGMTAGDFFSGIPEAAGLPPVEHWHNPSDSGHCGDSRMHIARDGTWFHDGTPIGRKDMVRLFAGLLRKDPDGFVLVTPVEKLSIAVEDAPFLAVLLEAEGEGRDQRLTLTTNVGDRVALGPEHGLRVVNGVPYIHVRRGLEARVGRAVYYQLADLAVPADGAHGVWSGGVFFALGEADIRRARWSTSGCWSNCAPGCWPRRRRGSNMTIITSNRGMFPSRPPPRPGRRC